MPGSAVNAIPAGVLPQSLCRAFARSQEYPDVTGSPFLNLDASMVKSVAVTERIPAEIRLDSFNVPNSMTWNDPSTAITNTFFGRSSNQFNLNGIGVGRTTRMGLRLRF
jgi:hypothetical protein